MTKLLGAICLIFLISISVVSFAETLDNPEAGDQEENTEQANQSPELDPIPVEPLVQNEAPKQAPEHEDTGDEAKNYTEADLTEQTRMADASEDMLKLADRQLIATYGEIILLIFAVGAAVWAATAAARAAKSAQASVDVASATAKRQLRAYVIVNGCSFEDLPNSKGFMISAYLKNCGTTPAYNARLMGESFATDYPLTEDKPHPVPEDGYGTPIGAGDEIICAYSLFTDDPKGALDLVKSGKYGMWIQGTVLYEDCFGNEHFLRFRYVFGGRLAKSGGIVLHADKEGNEAD